MGNGMSHYIYGFIESEQPCCFGTIGIGNQKNVYTIGFRDIAAVVSDYPLTTFDRLDKPQLTELARGHQLAIERVSQRYTIIPLQFGNVADSQTSVEKMMRQAYIQLKTLFQHIRGKVELVIQASANKQAWIDSIARTDPIILARVDTMNSLSELEKHCARLEIGKMIFDALANKEREIVDEIQATLCNGAQSCVCGPLSGEGMIFNGSFLVEKESEASFDQKVNDLAQKYDSALSFKYIGPMPPISFIHLKLELTDHDLIDNARRILGLPETATSYEIKSAYRSLAAQRHPDKNSDVSQAEKQFKEITDAVRILETYCQNYRYSFDRRTIEETVLIHSLE